MPRIHKVIMNCDQWTDGSDIGLKPVDEGPTNVNIGIMITGGIFLFFTVCIFFALRYASSESPQKGAGKSVRRGRRKS